MKKYNVWIHLEEVIMDKKGNEIDCKSRDDIFMPIKMGIISGKEDKDISKAYGKLDIYDFSGILKQH